MFIVSVFVLVIKGAKVLYRVLVKIVVFSS